MNTVRPGPPSPELPPTETPGTGSHPDPTRRETPRAPEDRLFVACAQCAYTVQTRTRSESSGPHWLLSLIYRDNERISRRSSRGQCRSPGGSHCRTSFGGMCSALRRVVSSHQAKNHLKISEFPDGKAKLSGVWDQTTAITGSI